MLTRFGFQRKMVYLCTSKEERALNKRVFSSFFGQKNGIFTSEINFSTLLRKIFFGVCGSFLSNVGGFFTDAERLKVKRYLFSKSPGNSKIVQLQKMAMTVLAYKRGILAWYDCHISTGNVEGINNKIKVMKRNAYGFRDEEYFK